MGGDEKLTLPNFFGSTGTILPTSIISKEHFREEPLKVFQKFKVGFSLFLGHQAYTN
jgi:hypothetical protein